MKDYKYPPAYRGIMEQEVARYPGAYEEALKAIQHENKPWLGAELEAKALVSYMSGYFSCRHD